MEVQLRFTVSEHGRVPENGERVMAAFMKVCPDGGPSISQNTENGTLTITFAFDAQDAKEAIERGVEIFVEGMETTGLPTTDVLDVEASVVAEREDTRELQPA